MLCDRRICHHVFCSQLFGFFPLGLCRRQPRNRQIHRLVCWKRHRISGVVGKQRNIGFVGFLGSIEKKWCRKYRKWLCCEMFGTESKLKESLAVWRNLLPYIFQGGLQPGSPSRRAAPEILNENLRRTPLYTRNSSCITLLWLHHNHKMSIIYRKIGLVSNHQSVARWLIFYVFCGENVLTKLDG